MAPSTPPSTSPEVHLVVILQQVAPWIPPSTLESGLWGSVAHIQSISQTITAKRDELANEQTLGNGDTPPSPLHVLCPRTNESDLTYDGIDACSLRVLDEIDDCIASLLPRRVTRFSIVGYSLGGLIARCCIGALEARSPSFFDDIHPCNFTTFASPAVGIPRFPTLLSRIFAFFGSRVLSRSGAQLYVTDDFLAGRPLLEVMAQPGTSFHNALLRFKRKQIFANTVNDRTVPFATGFFPEDHTDQFSHAEKRARARTKDHDSLSVDLAQGGLQLSFDESCPHIIQSIKHIDISKYPLPPRKQRFTLPSLPFMFQPSTFSGLPYGLGYVVPFFMPLLIPTFILYIIGRFLVQSHRSQRRIRALYTGELSTVEGRLRRLGLALEDGFEELAEEVFPVQSESEMVAGFDPIYKAAQKRMIKNLNAVPGLEKIMVYLPQERNSHGAIVCRSPSFEGHRKGLEVLKWWSNGFLF